MVWWLSYKVVFTFEFALHLWWMHLVLNYLRGFLLVQDVESNREIFRKIVYLFNSWRQTRQINVNNFGVHIHGHRWPQALVNADDSPKTTICRIAKGLGLKQSI